MYNVNNWYAEQQRMMLAQERMHQRMLMQAEREQAMLARQQEQMYISMARDVERQQREAERVAAQQQREYERAIMNSAGCSGGVDQCMGGVPPTAKGIVDYICMSLGTTDVTRADEFETQSTRHICPGERVIRIIQKNIFGVPTTKGMVYAEIIFCPNCGKLIINKNSINLI